jgi:hypothetical protein
MTIREGCEKILELTKTYHDQWVAVEPKTIAAICERLLKLEDAIDGAKIALITVKTRYQKHNENSCNSTMRWQEIVEECRSDSITSILAINKALAELEKDGAIEFYGKGKYDTYRLVKKGDE